MTLAATPPRIKKGDDTDDNETSSVRTDLTTVAASNVRRVTLSPQDNMEDQRIPASAAAAAAAAAARSWDTLLSAMHDANLRNVVVGHVLHLMRHNQEFGRELRLDAITNELQNWFPEHGGDAVLIHAAQDVVRFYNDPLTRGQIVLMVSEDHPVRAQDQLAGHFNVADVVVVAGDGEVSSLTASNGTVSTYIYKTSEESPKKPAASDRKPPGGAAV